MLSDPQYFRRSAATALSLTPTLTLTFQNIVNSSVVHNLPISQILRKSTHKLLSYAVHKQTDKQTDKHW